MEVDQQIEGGVVGEGRDRRRVGRGYGMGREGL